MGLSLSVPLLTNWPNGIAWYEEDHFIAGLGAVTGRGSASGTGATSSLSATSFAGHPGVWALVSGTASGAQAPVSYPGLLPFATAKYAYRQIHSPNTLFTGANTGQTFWGFVNAVGAAPTSGIYFQYDTAISATVPNCVVAGAGSLSVTSGVTLVAASWYDSLIVVDNDLKTVEFYLTTAPAAGIAANGLFPYYGAPVATFSMPSVLAAGMVAGITTIKGATGATSATTNLDYWGLAMGHGALTVSGASLLSMN